MTQEEIKQQIDAKRVAFQNSLFGGEGLYGLNELLMKAIMNNSPQAVPYFAKRIQDMIMKDESSWSIYEVGLALNIIGAAIPKDLFPDIYEYLNSKDHRDKLTAHFNKITKDFEDKLQREQIALGNMGGQNGKPTLAKA